MQCISDSWRNTVGSAAIAIILAYCNSDAELKDSDDNRKEFAEHYLENLHFLYKKPDGDDPKVSTPLLVELIHNTIHHRNTKEHSTAPSSSKLLLQV